MLTTIPETELSRLHDIAVSIGCDPTFGAHLTPIATAPEPVPSFTVDSRALAKALAVCKPAVPGRTALPVLANVLIRAEHDGISLTTTNLDIAVVQHLPAHVSCPFTTTVSHKALSDALKGATGDATITLDAGRISSTINGGTHTFSTIPAQDFPVCFAAYDQGPDITMLGPDLSRIIARVRHAIAKDQSRPILSGISLRTKGGNITAAAADGFVLSTDSAPADGKFSADIVVTGETAKALAAAKITGGVTLTYTQSRVYIAYEGGAILARTIDGTYPDVAQIIPRTSDATFTVRADELANALKSLQPVSRNNNDVSRWNASTMNGTIALEAKATDVGEVTAPVPVIEHTENHQDFALNTEYVLDMIKCSRAAALTFGLNGPNQAVKVTEDGTNAITIIMPMVISDR